MRLKDRRGADFLPLVELLKKWQWIWVRKFNISYRDLPFNVYQFSMKFEMRCELGALTPCSGIHP